MDVLLITLKGENAAPVAVWLQGADRQSLTHVEVYRVSISRKVEPFTKRTAVGANLLRVEPTSSQNYYRSIRLALPTQQKPAFDAVIVSVGSKSFRYTSEKVRTDWRLVDSTASTVVFETPGDLYFSPSRLPVFNAVLNWKGDGALIRTLLLNSGHLTFLLILLIVAQRLPLTRWATLFQIWLEADSRRPRRLTVGLIAGLTILRYPFELSPVTTGLDPSWILGLNWAYANGLTWGQDVVFTYGPLFWLLYPSLILPSSVLILAAGLTLVLTVYALGVLVDQLVDAVRSQTMSVFVGFIILWLLAFVEYNLLDIITVACLVVLTRPIRGRFNGQVLPVLLILAIISLIKLSYLAISFALLIFYTGLAIRNRRMQLVPIAWLGFGFSLLTLWMLSGQQLTNLGPFLTRAYQIAQGYSEAMSTPIWNEEISVLGNLVELRILVVAALSMLVLGIVFLTTPIRSRLWVCLLLSSPIVFLAFKEGFVRYDRVHFVLFFSQWLLILLAYRLVLTPDKRPRFPGLNWVWLGSLLVCLIILPVKWPAYGADLLNVLDAGVRAQTLQRATQAIRSQLKIDAGTQDVFQRKLPVDVMPYNIALLYAYGANWKPRPIMQSYAAYAGPLDSLNASYSKSEKAPPYLLYSFTSIDDQYPFFDEPLTLPTLLSDYEIASADTALADTASYLLLRRKLTPTAETYSRLGRQQVSLGQPVLVPKKTNQFTYVKARVNLSLWGKLLNFVYKIPPLHISLEPLGDTQPVRYDLNRQTAPDGLLVSHHVQNLKEAAKLWSAQTPANVRTIRFVGDGLIYESPIQIEFVGVSR